MLSSGAWLDSAGSPADRVLIRDVARITHHSDEAYAGALAVIAAVRMSAAAASVPENLITRVINALPDTRLRDRLQQVIAANEPPEAIAARFGTSGYVVEVVPLALSVAVYGRANTVAAGIERAVALGGDTDTIASIAGQIVGASGAEAPEHPRTWNPRTRNPGTPELRTPEPRNP